MARFLSLLVLFLATCLLAVGPAASMSAAESNRFGTAEFPEANPRTPSSAPAAEPPRAEPPSVVAPAPVAPAPVSLETKAAGPGFFDWIISGITRVLNLDRGKSTAVETPPVVQAPPQVVAEKTDALAAEINVAVAPEPAPASELAENPASTAVNIVWPIPSLISVVAAKPEPTPEPAPAAAPALTSVIAVKPAPTPEPAPAAAPALISVIAVKPAPTPTPAAAPAPTPVIAVKPAAAPAPAPASVIAVKPAAAPAPTATRRRPQPPRRPRCSLRSPRPSLPSKCRRWNPPRSFLLGVQIGSGATGDPRLPCPRWWPERCRVCGLKSVGLGHPISLGRCAWIWINVSSVSAPSSNRFQVPM